MFSGAKMRAMVMASALGLAMAAPAAANTEIEPRGYEAAISDAKKAMVADPAKALDLARSARIMVISKDKVITKDQLVANWLEGEALMRLNRADEAAGVIGFALFEASQKHQNDKIYADLLRSSASLKARGDDPKTALKHFTMAQTRYQELGDKRSQAIVLQNIGSLYSRAQNFDEVLRHYGMAADVFTDNAILSLSSHNNIGFALIKVGRPEEAIESIGKALAIAENMKSPLLKARILTNLAAAQNRAGLIAEADASATEAMALAQDHAKTWMPFIYGVQAEIELSRGNLAQADALIAKAFAGQKLDNTNALFRDFHKIATDILSQRGNKDLAAVHKAAFERHDAIARNLNL